LMEAAQSTVNERWQNLAELAHGKK